MLGKQGEGVNHSAGDPEQSPVAAPGAGAAVWTVMGMHTWSMPRATAVAVLKPSHWSESELVVLQHMEITWQQ